MTRVLVIIALVGLTMATGVAGASTATEVRVPATAAPEQLSFADAPDSVVVVEGDHLWKISARHLGKEVSNEEIAPYWRVVIDVNLPRLTSGDPDLIYPGEVVELPTIREQP